MLEPLFWVTVGTVADFVGRWGEVETPCVNRACEVSERYNACFIFFGNFLKGIEGVSTTRAAVSVSVEN
eukprot:4277253-Heterocapsa_arctica.AAC.1